MRTLGPFYMGGGAGTNALQVGCVQPEFLPAQGGWLNLENRGRTASQLIAYLGHQSVQFPPTIVDWDIVLLSNDLNDFSQACAALPDDTPDLSESIVLLRLSQGCEVYTQQANLEMFGAKYILLYTDSIPDNGYFSAATVSSNSTVGFTLTTVAQIILDELQSGGRTTFTAPDVMSVAGIYAGPDYPELPCYYTSWGPLFSST